MINLFQQRRKAPLASVAESQEISPPTSPSKSVKFAKSAQSWPTASGSGTDSVNPASYHAESEQITRAQHYLTSMGALRVIRDVEDHLREKRFFLNQLWQLFSALNKFADEETMEHATQAAQALSNHLSDGVVKIYDQDTIEKGGLSLSEQAAKDVEKVERRTNLLFTINDPDRHKNWRPDT